MYTFPLLLIYCFMSYAILFRRCWQKLQIQNMPKEIIIASNTPIIIIPYIKEIVLGNSMLDNMLKFTIAALETPVSVFSEIVLALET